MYESKFIIGIDLGTTNIAVTYIDIEDNNRVIQQFDITQFNAPGEVAKSKLLPSFCFFPDSKMTSKEAMDLPWKKKLEYAVGIYAREFGAAIPNRFISSAKSWLCHIGVDRRSRILPWGGDIEEVKRSPLDITSYYLKHIKSAWNHEFGKVKDSSGSNCVIEDQQVVITVPASFDETARELTLESAKLAGYKNINLLEEPLAAFYSWLDSNDKNWKDYIAPGERALVIDVGGGTCDLSVIEMTESGSLVRSVAGNHLLLGGDNIDIAIARKIELFWKTKLTPGEWLTLCQKTRQSKEILLSSDKEETDIVLFAQGSSIIANMRKYSLKKNELEEMLLDGFFPVIDIDSKGPAKKTAIQQMGLPYENDPALTRHILQFLKYAHKVSDTSISDNNILYPNKILFNGGTMIPEILRDRVVKIIKGWFPADDIEELDSIDLSLAVAYGAAYYGRTRRGEGVKVKSGTSRSYYLQVANDTAADEGRLVCIMPRGIDENIKIVTPNKFNVEANQTVKFPLYNSSTRLGDKEGVVLNNEEEVSFVSSLTSVLRYGKLDKKKLKAELVSELTETGVLKIHINSIDTIHRWPLNFDVRLLTSDDNENAPTKAVVLDENITKKAESYILEAFNSNKNNMPSIIKELEKIIGLSKDKWPLQALRSFADILLNIKYKSLLLPQKEARWLNLCGYCLRPGFGDPEDELRLRKVWTLWFSGMNNKNNPQIVAEWWVFWRRIISGLKSGHQRTVYQDLHTNLYPKGKYLNNIKAGQQAKAEMWRCIGSLELLQTKIKLEIGNILTSRIKNLQGYEFWVLARLGARHLFHGQTNHVIPPKLISGWIAKLISNSKTSVSLDRLFAVSRIAAMTGDRMIDIDSELQKASIEYLEKEKSPENWISHLEGVKKDSIQEQAKMLGDSIPLGISIK
ncbi:MAG: Hsp70 family protein [bacterium]|nr:Hsp70 family protein [bacterium]